MNNLSDNTPILVAAGQYVERQATDHSHMHIAGQAAQAALASTGVDDLAQHIDTICVIRTFTDSPGQWESPFGRSDNPPQSVAKAIGATPKDRIYSNIGGNEPQSRIIEFSADIAKGERSLVLLAGGEALRNMRTAARAGEKLDWEETHSQEMEDRGFGKIFVSDQEIANQLFAPMFYYTMFEQAQATRAGRDTAAQKAFMAAQMTSMSDVAAHNPYAQFPSAMSADEILSAGPLNHLYTRRMIAQDGVNLGAAVLLTSVGKARELGINEDQWVFIHGQAEGVELVMTERDDLSRSLMAEAVLDRIFEQSHWSVEDLDLIEIYSCFPCAVTVVAEHLDLPNDGSRPLTLTGGLPFFGGPGNNYAMHGIAEAVNQLQSGAGERALVTCNGGMLSKHASGLYSRTPNDADWSVAETSLSNEGFVRRTIAPAPSAGKIVTYTVNYAKDVPQQAMVIGETPEGERFVCKSAPDDVATPAAMLGDDVVGRDIKVELQDEGALYFQLA
ncbi:MAG: hypothetical protein ABJ013_05950 [Halioglobus sp.]